MRLYHIDAFADRPFTGNPAAVVLLDQWLDAGLMQSIAAENNLAETAFAIPQGPEWQLRWFTPTQEADFCGHATLATAHVIFDLQAALQEVRFHTRAGELIVTRQADSYAMSLPRLEPHPLASLPTAVQAMFDTPPLDLFQSDENLFAVMANPQSLRDFRPDFVAMEVLGTTGLVITAPAEPESAADFLSRSFAPGVGIPEDPVTGSTHASLVPYWAKRLGKYQMRAYQASKRGGWIGCSLTPERVILTGQAVTYLTGEINL